MRVLKDILKKYEVFPRLVLSRFVFFFYFRGNIGKVFPPLHCLKKSDYSSLGFSLQNNIFPDGF